MASYRPNLDELVTEFLSGQSLAADGDVDNIEEQFAGKIPEAITEIWGRVGFGAFFGGYFQLCDPRRYAVIVERVLEDDPDFAAEKTHVIGFSAFGHLLAWNEDYRTVSINLVMGQLSCRWFSEQSADVDPNMSLISGLIFSDSPAHDVMDNNGKGMFSRALKRLGPLPYGSIYGFRPILALGGPRDPERLSIYEAMTHMSILAQATPFKLVDHSALQPRIIRMIGDPS